MKNEFTESILNVHVDKRVCTVRFIDKMATLQYGILISVVNPPSGSSQIYRVEYEDGTAIDFTTNDIEPLAGLFHQEFNVLTIRLSGGRELLKQY